MFHVVSFDSDFGKERTVVPSIWLNKSDSICIFPPVTKAAEIESLAQLCAQPTDGWHMYSVKSLKIFDTYEEAKEYLERLKKTVAALEKEISDMPKRKKRRPAHFSEYTDVDFGSEDPPRQPTANASPSSSPSRGDGSALDPHIVRVEPLSSQASILTLDDFIPFFSSSSGPSRSTHRIQTSTRKTTADLDDTCACKSACHRLILKYLKEIRQGVETNTKLLRNLVDQQQSSPNKALEPRALELPKNFPLTFPMTELSQLEEFDVYLLDDANFAQTASYFTIVGGNDGKQTLRRMMEKLISPDLAMQMNWKGRGNKQPFSTYSRIHSLLFDIIKKNPKSGRITLSEVEKFIKDWLRFSPDRYNGRHNRKSQNRPEQDEKMDMKDSSEASEDE